MSQSVFIGLKEFHFFASLSVIALVFLPAVQAGGILFEDVTIIAGLNTAHTVPQNGDALFCREEVRMSAGAAAIDVNGDGWTDLYVTRIGSPNLLYINNTDGTFTEDAAASGVDLVANSSGVAFADIDNDGDDDLYVQAILDQRRYLYINDGMGIFTEEAVKRGAAFFGLVIKGTSATFGDYDNDGDLDIHILEWLPSLSNNLLLQNDGAGNFTDVTIFANVSMPTTFGFANAFADINDDTFPDLLIAADFGTSRLFQNMGNGQFTDITLTALVGTDENGMGSAVGDYDGDGDLDWFVTSIFDSDETCDSVPCNWGYTGNRLYRNDTNGNFTDATDLAGVREGYWGWGASFFDYDNDGDLDLGMTNGVDFPCIEQDATFNTDPLRLWNNDGTGVMTEVSDAVQFTDNGSGKGFVVFDYDNDGDLDVFIANNNGMPVLFRNNGGNANNWLRVNVIGEITNRMGLGARVKVRVNPGDSFQLREINANNNYMSQNETTAHFGLGSSVSSVDLVRVEWPVTGFVQEFRNVASNTTLIVQEGNSIDLDGVVDNADRNAIQHCLINSSPGSIPIGCGFADLNADGNVDCSDWQILQNLWTEPTPPPTNFQCDGVVPTSSEWGMVTICLGLLTAGTLVFRRTIVAI